MAVPSRAWNSSRSLPGIVGSNPAGDMDVCLLRIWCVVRLSFLRRVHHSPCGVLPSVGCLNVIMNPRRLEGLGPLQAVALWGKNENMWRIIGMVVHTYILGMRRNSLITFN